MDWLLTKVLDIIKETADSVSIVFDISQAFNWTPGQHIQLKLNIKGEEYVRNYSISSQIDTPLQITVKAVKNGIVSNYINKQVRVGDTLQISNANGHFTHSANPKCRQSYYFFAAGSGITPIYCMINHILATEPHSFVYLLYGNKDVKSTIFKEKLDKLLDNYQHQFVLKECLSAPSWFKTSPWHTGRMDAKAVTRFIKQKPPYAQSCQYFICGPGEFIPNIKQALNEIDVPNSRIHTEYFAASELEYDVASMNAELTVLFAEKTHKIKVTSKQTILEAMKTANLEVPYSCESGVCGTCKCTINQGTIEMAHNSVLQSKELKQGKILACQAYPTSEYIKISYDE